MEGSLNRKYLAAKRANHSATIGALIAFGLIGFGIALGGNALSFIDLPGIFIVLGGTIGGTLLTYSIDEVKMVMPAVKNTSSNGAARLSQRLDALVRMSHHAKAEGAVSMERFAVGESDPFLKRGLQLLVDNFSEEEFRKSLEVEYRNADDGYRVAADVLNAMGTIAPAMGLIGTIIGLVHMLHHLNSPEQIGPGMATALITTLYGAVLAFLLFNPLADKLRIKSVDESRIREMTYEALQLIHENLHPGLLEQRLSSFVAKTANAHAQF